jgi:hypothetical protein
MSLRALLDRIGAWWRRIVGTDRLDTPAVLHDVAPRSVRKVAPAKRTRKATQARRGARKPRKR